MTEHSHEDDMDVLTMLQAEFQKSGGDPSYVFDLLAGIIRRREWETILDEEGQPVGSLRRLIEAPMPLANTAMEEWVHSLRLEKAA